VDAEYKLARGLQPAILNATLELIYPQNTSFTGTFENKDSVLNSIGQINLEGETARLIFIFPKENDLVADVCCLIEGLGERAGSMGAHFLLAAAEENDQLHYALCQCSYRPLFSQKYWQIKSSREINTDQEYQWQPSSARDLLAIQSFLNSCLAPPIRMIWPIKPHNYPDALLFTGGELCGQASLHRFADTLIIYPLILPSLPHPEKALSSLIKYAQTSHRVFLVIPSFQSWLEGLQSKLFAETVLKQLILVKHFTLRQRAFATVEEKITIKKHGPEPTTPVISSLPREKN
jgi:hypothetical protein